MPVPHQICLSRRLLRSAANMLLELFSNMVLLFPVCAPSNIYIYIYIYIYIGVFHWLNFFICFHIALATTCPIPSARCCLNPIDEIVVSLLALDKSEIHLLPVKNVYTRFVIVGVEQRALRYCVWYSRHQNPEDPHTLRVSTNLFSFEIHLSPPFIDLTVGADLGEFEMRSTTARMFPTTL